ncbi:DUF485 domain-containing protein [Yinghuangia sp. ASG 101]|uniref:DUF485 domain-containing protein n=1 Tax=Yinghuangia sp. ASG 101 TaxID=2896848 RepID=UPI001E2AC498|nr:DUF485 domain-containing protein [Yinghuangia sp. ASG 101]UGQ10355.1 DUF485 domain-containing protein [Yinghuangia sp. ASG 101]
MTATSSATEATRPDPRPASSAASLHDDPRFRELRHRFRWFAFPLTVLALGWYLLYVLLCAYARGFMAHELADHVNVALVLGLGQFAATFLGAWLYSRYAARRLDPLSSALRAAAPAGAAEPLPEAAA